MCAKKTTMILVLLVLVLASALAWPSNNSATENKVEEVQVEVEKTVQKNSLKQVEGLQNVVSKTQDVLSGKKLTKEEVAEIEASLTDVEQGVDAMTKAFYDAHKFHLAFMPEVGYTIGQPVNKAFDFGFKLLANYKQLYATVGVNKAVDFMDFKSSVTDINGLRVTTGVGIRIF